MPLHERASVRERINEPLFARNDIVTALPKFRFPDHQTDADAGSQFELARLPDRLHIPAVGEPEWATGGRHHVEKQIAGSPAAGRRSLAIVFAKAEATEPFAQG